MPSCISFDLLCALGFHRLYEQPRSLAEASRYVLRSFSEQFTQFEETTPFDIIERPQNECHSNQA